MTAAARQMFFVDSRVADYQTLIAGLAEGSEWHLLHAGADGIRQMERILSAHTGLDAIQVISHGAPGTLYLGSTVLTAGNLASYEATLQAIGRSLSETGDILLYGCSVAQGNEGIKFVESLAQITGADVAASDDLTGAAEWGGDWDLEATAGTAPVEQAVALDDFRSVLAVSRSSPNYDLALNAALAELSVAAYKDGLALKSQLEYLGWRPAYFSGLGQDTGGGLLERRKSPSPTSPSDDVPIDAYGFVATREHGGKTQMVISFRGTESYWDWRTDLNEWGFCLSYSALQPLIRAAYKYALSGHIDQIYFTGHSLGGAIVQIALLDLLEPKTSSLWENADVAGSFAPLLNATAPGNSPRVTSFFTDTELADLRQMVLGGPEKVAGVTFAAPPISCDPENKFLSTAEAYVLNLSDRSVYAEDLVQYEQYYNGEYDPVPGLHGFLHEPHLGTAFVINLTTPVRDKYFSQAPWSYHLVKDGYLHQMTAYRESVLKILSGSQGFVVVGLPGRPDLPWQQNGTAANDLLVGNASGFEGNDILVDAGTGLQFMSGGSGHDTFVVNTYGANIILSAPPMSGERIDTLYFNLGGGTITVDDPTADTTDSLTIRIKATVGLSTVESVVTVRNWYSASNNYQLAEIFEVIPSPADYWYAHPISLADLHVPSFNRGGSGADTVLGGSSGDEMFGLEGADKMIGRGGNDMLCGGGGNDMLFGGSGTDTAIYEYNWQCYKLLSGRSTSQFSLQLTQFEGGTDSISTVERLQFANRTFESISSFFQTYDQYWSKTSAPTIPDQPTTVDPPTPLPPGTGAPRLYVTASSVAEGDSGSRTIKFAVTLSHASTQPVSFIWSATGGNLKGQATAGSDFKFDAATHVFAPGQVASSVSVTVYGDTKTETDEYFDFLVSNLVGATLASGGRIEIVKGWIINDDADRVPPPPPKDPPGNVYLSIETNDPSEYEGADGTSVEYDFYVSRTGDLDQRTDYHIGIGGYGASPATADDFDILRYPDEDGSFGPGESRERWTVRVRGDALQETHDYFRAILTTDEPNALISDKYAYAAILNDDGDTVPSAAGQVYLSIRALHAQVVEGTSTSSRTPVQFEIHRSGDLAQVTDFRLSFPTGHGRDSPDLITGTNDGVSGSHSPHFEIGQSKYVFTKYLNADDYNEPDEFLTAQLRTHSNSPNAVILEDIARVLVLNDDGPAPARITAPATIVQETDGPRLAHIRVYLSHPMSVDVAMDYTVSGAGAGADFVAETGLFVIPAGAAYGDLAVTILGDDGSESYEDLAVELENPTNGYFGHSNIDSWDTGVVIVDDDRGDGFFPTADALDAASIDLGDLGIYELKQLFFQLNDAAQTLTFKIEVTDEMVIQSVWPVPDFIFDGAGRLLHADIASFDYIESSRINGIGDNLVFLPGIYYFHYSGGYSPVGESALTEFVGVPTDAAVPLLSIDLERPGEVNGVPISTNFGVVEGGVFWIPLRLSHPVDHAVSLDLEMRGITADPDDLGPMVSTRITIAAGKTVVSHPWFTEQDTRFEGLEYFEVIISNVSGAILPNGQSSFARPGTIVDDDQNLSPEFDLIPVALDRAEGTGDDGLFSFRVDRPAAFSANAASVDWRVVGSGLNPASAADFSGNVMPSGTVSFAAAEYSKTVAIRVSGDGYTEADETFTVQAYNPKTGFGLHNATLEFIIRSDDGLPSGPVYGEGTVTTGVSYTMMGADVGVVVTGGAPVDISGNALGNSIAGNNAANGIAAGDGADKLFGRKGDDTLDGGVGGDELYGDEGNDQLLGGEGDDVIDGGDGVDVASFTGTASATVDLGLTTAQNTGHGTDLILNVEHLTSGSGNDWLTGNALGNSLSSGPGNDTLDGGGGADSMTGGDGNDFYYVDHAGDVVSETNATAAGGIDLVFTTVASYTLGAHVENARILASGAANLTGNTLDNLIYAGIGNNVLNGGTGSDTVTWVSGVSGASGVTASLASGSASGSGNDTLIGIEHLIGSSNADRLTGNGNANKLSGGLGNDTLDGGGGADSMTGGDGNDFYYVDHAGDVVSETNATAAGGIDLVFTTVASYTLGAHVENARILATGAANLSGNALDNLLYAGIGNNVLDGGTGSDTVTWVYGVTGASGVTASLASGTASGSGNDTLIGIEHLIGSSNADRLTGDGNANNLSGGLGNDTLDGGGGADTR
jgi:Ca2+-binding RTX toxin-like protein